MGRLGTVFLLAGATLLAVVESQTSSAIDNTTDVTFPQTTEIEDCPTPFIEISGRCIYVNTLESGTWAQTENLCVLLHGTLVKIDTGLFLQDLVSYIEGFGLAGDFWTGGSDRVIEGAWRWLDGTPVPMGTPFWAYYPSEPIVQQPIINTEANCLCLREYYLYFFMSCSCESSFAPICQYDRGRGAVSMTD